MPLRGRSATCDNAWTSPLDVNVKGAMIAPLFIRITMRLRGKMAYSHVYKVLILVLGLSGCGEVFSLKGDDQVVADGSDATVQISEESGAPLSGDTEAPEVFSVTELALWDGRPTFGGIWVAHPEVTEPERVIIRNNANGRSVSGALFRRERDTLGRRIQVSADAAAELGLVAGSPVELEVVALTSD